MTEPRMRAVVCDDFGGPDALGEREVDRPPVGPNSVLVRLAYAGVNPGDSRIRQGQFVGKGRHVFPLVLGMEGAGTVEASGVGGSPFAPGQAVYGFFLHDYAGDGTYAEFAPARVAQLATVPDGVPLRDAAAVACAGGTASVLIEELLEVKAGDTVVVLGAAGGVGHFAVQLAAASGARVIGVARAAHHALVRGLGAGEVVDHRIEDVPARLAELAPAGVDRVVDTVGGAAQEAMAAVLRSGGRIASCVHPSTGGALQVRYAFFEATPERMSTLSGHLATRRIRPRITAELPLEQAAAAHAVLDAGGHPGKIVLRIR